MMNRNLVYVVGLGPGNAQFLTAQARAALQNADVLCGYTTAWQARCWSWQGTTRM